MNFLFNKTEEKGIDPIDAIVRFITGVEKLHAIICVNIQLISHAHLKKVTKDFFWHGCMYGVTG